MSVADSADSAEKIKLKKLDSASSTQNPTNLDKNI